MRAWRLGSVGKARAELACASMFRRCQRMRGSGTRTGTDPRVTPQDAVRLEKIICAMQTVQDGASVEVRDPRIPPWHARK